ncbi:unnamed protein product (macronuclear) [Paramecium tetraurelia]|uniref:Uncharacterized protein n=1 Tax=Paramecium tetraurelia TaxID=5888 RepID=A0EGT5_PARTE|nr:uncharacterized protein GSPATT00026850001 [Paramecium tetraurelia]CAK94526.1 unnamed protein product [Paramecium tetraurelia]|eukprot:XP_001461899.1 hypothetical protein (macronuclear) [Paramecium tetraurelia strain d4-2]
MNCKTLVLVVLAFTAVQVFGEPVAVSQSFTANDFSDADGWTVAGAPAHVTECSGTKMFGGFGKFGARAVASKAFELPPHSYINIKLQFWKIDSWDIKKLMSLLMTNQHGQESSNTTKGRDKSVAKEVTGRKWSLIIT